MPGVLARYCPMKRLLSLVFGLKFRSVVSSFAQSTPAHQLLFRSLLPGAMSELSPRAELSNLLGQVVAQADLLDDAELAFQVGDVMVLISKDLLE